MADTKVCAVVVFYRRRPADSNLLRQLLALAHAGGEVAQLAKVIAYDNSPSEQGEGLLVEGCDYVADPVNGGVTPAYNHAWQVARANGASWLWLLDQDTDLTSDFWAKTLAAVEAADASVMAIVPRVWDGPRMVSPTRIMLGDRQRPVADTDRGRCDFEVAAIGSGILVRREFLDRIGGFDRKYWLDSADRKLFAQIWQSGGRVFVSDARLKHELSVFDFDRRVSEARYHNILKYEWIFQQECKTRLDHAVLMLRLLYRTVKLAIIARNKRHAVITFGQFLRVGRDVVAGVVRQLVGSRSP